MCVDVIYVTLLHEFMLDVRGFTVYDRPVTHKQFYIGIINALHILLAV